METHGRIMLPVALGAADDFIVELMLPYKTILTLGGRERGREACRGGAVATVLITSSRAGIRVHRSDVPLGAATRAPTAFSS
jgi:hypothetical protein